MNKALLFQAEQFKKLKEKLRHSNQDLVSCLMQILSLSRSVVYSRIQGDKPLTIEEINNIQQYFGLPGDYFTSMDNNHVSFLVGTMNGQPDHLNAFLQPLLTQLRMLQTLPNIRIFYASNELPFFHYFKYPELACFKLYVWNMTTWQIPFFKNKPFDTAIIREHLAGEFETIATELHQAYGRIATTELWPLHMLDNTIQQILYVDQAKLFKDPTTSSRLFGHLEQLIRDLQDDVASGVKNASSGGAFEVYHNEITFSNNLILVTHEDVPMQVYATYDNPNYITSTSPAILQYTRAWIQKMTDKSMLISGSGLRQRLRYFDRLLDKLNRNRQNPV